MTKKPDVLITNWPWHEEIDGQRLQIAGLRPLVDFNERSLEEARSELEETKEELDEVQELAENYYSQLVNKKTEVIIARGNLEAVISKNDETVRKLNEQIDRLKRLRNTTNCKQWLLNILWKLETIKCSLFSLSFRFLMIQWSYREIQWMNQSKAMNKYWRIKDSPY